MIRTIREALGFRAEPIALPRKPRPAADQLCMICGLSIKKTATGYILCSANEDLINGELQVSCEHASPQTCFCGLYAYTSLSDWDVFAREKERPLWGLIQPAGTVYKREQRYQVRQGRIEALYYNGDFLNHGNFAIDEQRSKKILWTLSRTIQFDVEVPMFDSLESMCAEYGIS